MEFKTTELSHETPADVWTQTPQDLEQLLFYALMTNRSKETHSLVYYRQNERSPFRAYRARITETGRVKQYLLQRKSALETALAKAAPERLGRCRYYISGCDYRTQSICGCDRLAPPETRELEDSVELNRDEEMENRLTQVRTATPPLPRTRVRAWDLFVPRQAFRDLTDPKPFENRLFDEDYSQRIWLERKIADSDIAGKFGDLRAPGTDGESVSLGWSGTVVLRRTTKQGVDVREVPFLLRVPKPSSPKELQRISDAYYAQLALRCALVGSSDGILALIFPRSNYQALCWRVEFKDQPECKKKIENRLHQLMAAIKASDPVRLPLCPSWTRDDCGEGCLCPRALGNPH